MKSCINGVDSYEFETQKCGKILCAHKPFSHAGSHIINATCNLSIYTLHTSVLIFGFL